MTLDELRTGYEKSRIIDAGMNNPVERSLVSPDSLKPEIRQLLETYANTVVSCVQKYTDTDGAEKSRTWWEINGKRCHAKPSAMYLKSFITEVVCGMMPIFAVR